MSFVGERLHGLFSTLALHLDAPCVVASLSLLPPTDPLVESLFTLSASSPTSEISRILSCLVKRDHERKESVETEAVARLAKYKMAVAVYGVFLHKLLDVATQLGSDMYYWSAYEDAAPVHHAYYMVSSKLYLCVIVLSSSRRILREGRRRRGEMTNEVEI